MYPEMAYKQVKLSGVGSQCL